MIYLAFFVKTKKSATAILRTICVLFLYKTERKAGEYTEEKKKILLLCAFLSKTVTSNEIFQLFDTTT